MNNTNILLATVTRNRPLMLCSLLRSLEKIQIPENVTLHFLIVENNEIKSLEKNVGDFQSRMTDGNIKYLLEKNIGISFSRNCALNYAIENNYDFLVFIDDDEYAEPSWLVELFAEQQRNDLDLVGSPVRPVPIEGQLTTWQKFIWSGLERLGRYSEQKTRRRCLNGSADTIKVATGSWMGRLDFFRETGIRFDTSLSITGGEDWHLCTKAKSLGARTGWAPAAIVYETVPLVRLTLAYHFRRNRDHNTTEFVTAYRKSPQRAFAQLPLKLASRFWKLLVSILFIPFKGAAAVIAMAMTLGGLCGLLRGCAGKQSVHYKHTTGH